MNVLQVCLFGKFNAHCNGQIVAGLESLKVQELLSYLLLHRDSPHSREILASLLWGGTTSSSQSRKYLRKALWQLQSALDVESEPGSGPVLLVESDWIQFNPVSDLWLDVALFEEACVAVSGMRGQELSFQQVFNLLRALALYQGDLLEGYYQDWCLYERQRLQHMHLVVLDKLMGYCEAHREYDAGLACGTLILRYDTAHERTHWRMMRLYCLLGDRTAAMRQYERCVVALKKELGAKPANRTKTLYEQIRSGRMQGLPSLPVKTATAPHPSAVLLSDILERLQGYQVALADLQHQLDQDIQAISLALNDRV